MGFCAQWFILMLVLASYWNGMLKIFKLQSSLKILWIYLFFEVATHVYNRTARLPLPASPCAPSLIEM